MEKIEGTLVTGHLARIFESYRRIYAAHMIVKKEYFEHFTTEAIIYARLEWSKFIRDGFSEKEHKYGPFKPIIAKKKKNK